jgi:hypothetical protein
MFIQIYRNKIHKNKFWGIFFKKKSLGFIWDYGALEISQSGHWVIGAFNSTNQAIKSLGQLIQPIKKSPNQPIRSLGYWGI